MQSAKCLLALVGFIALGSAPESLAAEFHVSPNGDDQNRGTKSKPLRTIQGAAEMAMPGDVVTVHAGIYRERINPPRGGASDKRRVVYQAARGEQVEILGSEPVVNWTHVQGKIWKATLPNSFFGGFNPYTNLIAGDWFNGRGRAHHTGAVYVDGHWLVEATRLDELMSDQPPAWLAQGGNDYLLNVAWLRPQGTADQVPANAFAAQNGIQTAPCSEGGECIGFIEHGEWVRYQDVDFGTGATRIELRAASATRGGIIEVRLGAPDGELLGACEVPHTGGWQSWKTFTARIKETSGKKVLCLVFKVRPTRQNTALQNSRLWFAEVDQQQTTIWAQLDLANPNNGSVEINVRQTVFYPDRPGRNYITVRGFKMRNAATQWAPPTAEQMGLIGTHWSKGWIIEDNEISHSICSGIALGKYGDAWDNTSANTAEGYVKTIERALQNGWNKKTIGAHVVRNNRISHCEQTGIVGSLGSAFCTVTGNTISDIHVRRLFTGAEMAGIKFHAAIDTVLSNNHIYRTCLGLWLDWMAQGTRVSGNVFHDNDRDLFMEVDHGPYLIDNNLFLSEANLLDMSEGGAYVHNLFAGRITSAPEPNRETPYHPPHETEMAGLTTIKGGDNRFYNNIFVGRGASEPGAFGLAMYNPREFPTQTGGNVFYDGAQPYLKETSHVTSANKPNPTLVADGGVLTFKIEPGADIQKARTVMVTTELLGKAIVPKAGYENPDGSPLKIDRDILGKKRDRANPTPGPFEIKAPLGPQEWVLRLQ